MSSSSSSKKRGFTTAFYVSEIEALQRSAAALRWNVDCNLKINFRESQRQLALAIKLESILIDRGLPIERKR
jgi:hypothetical protein